MSDSKTYKPVRDYVPFTAEERDALPDLITCEEMARIMRCTPRYAARICEQGRVRAAKCGLGWRANKADVLAFAALA